MKKYLLTIMILTNLSLTLEAYKITNSPMSDVATRVAISTKKGLPPIPVKAGYYLIPGQSGAWNQKEIRKKLKTDTLFALISIPKDPTHPQARVSKYINFQFPINGNLEFFIARIGDNDYIWTAIDRSTNKIYNQSEYDTVMNKLKQKAATLPH